MKVIKIFFIVLFYSFTLYSQDGVEILTEKGNYLKKIIISDSTFLYEWGNKNIQRTLSDTFDISIREPYFEWENDYAMGVSRGCGSPCWYEYILPLNTDDSAQVIYYPIEHSLKNNLVAFIEYDSSVTIKNFKDNRTIKIYIEPSCNSVFLGYCIESIQFNEEEVEIRWFSGDNFNIDENKKPDKNKKVNISYLVR